MIRTFYYSHDDKEYVVEVDWGFNGVWLRVRNSQTGEFSETHIELEPYILKEIAKLGGKLHRTDT